MEIERIRFVSLQDGESIFFRLPNYEELAGTIRFQLWNNEARRYEMVDKFTKGRSESYIRDVELIEKDSASKGEEYYMTGLRKLSMSKTVNEQFLHLLGTLKVMGKETLNTVFKMTRKGERLQTKYTLEMTNIESGKVVEKIGD